MLVLALTITWNLGPCLLDFAILGFSYFQASLAVVEGRAIEVLPTVHIVLRIGNSGSFSRQAVQDALRGMGQNYLMSCSLGQSLPWAAKEAEPQEG